MLRSTNASNILGTIMTNRAFDDEYSFDQMFFDNEEQQQRESVWKEVMNEVQEDDDIYSEDME